MGITKNRAVDVYVDAKQLFVLGEGATEEQIDKLTALASNELVDGQYVSSSWTSHKEYELHVYLNHTMQWIILPMHGRGEDNGYEVKLLSVHHEPEGGNPNYFTTEDLNVGSDGTITATVSNNSVPGKDYIYTIKFSITHDGVTNRYSIDPKLAINS